MRTQHKFLITTDAKTNSIVSVQQIGSAGELIDLSLSSLSELGVLASPRVASTSVPAEPPAVRPASPGVFFENELPDVREASPGVFIQNELPEIR